MNLGTSYITSPWMCISGPTWPLTTDALAANFLENLPAQSLSTRSEAQHKPRGARDYKYALAPIEHITIPNSSSPVITVTNLRLVLQQPPHTRYAPWRTLVLHSSAAIPVIQSDQHLSGGCRFRFLLFAYLHCPLERYAAPFTCANI